ncbi:amylovoran biosynthesis protein AmsF [Candidatus Pantoea symbiotica]|jgi:amylovoran biosynthesis protein AmsF|uniref:Amylovoran biosynthesis protein AmsF n=1 Tax=Candidatus Pantoea symbiotica TaxID=1884370 RepID=A0A1I3ZX86_9GAMM|nr:amylovoran biosynthesis protein AmsF [Pantoea symbiotica]SFU91448.1 amylovoran biosynthesis protein AmsF [Pantoea sp. YR525]
MANASNSSNTTPQNAVAAAAPVIQISDVAQLKATEPTTGGELATVLEYKRGTKAGGGVFVYDATDTSSPDDGGLIIVTAGNKRWKRVILDYNSVTVLDFGAVPDGKTDCIEAVKRMYTWSQRVLPSAGIRFTAGVFSMSTFDISDKEINRFKVAGAAVNFGYFPTTTLVFNWETKPRGLHFFKVQARYAEISGIVVKGMSSDSGGDGGTAFNTVGFYANTIIGGQFLRVSSMEFRYLGGRALDLIDTLDCKIDQFYSRGCQDSIVYARWSDREQGAWDHSTAIELSNFNLQGNTKKPVLDLPRCTQSFIRNGWIEHAEFAGDLTNGQWVIEGLAIESTTNPLKLGYCRATIIQKSIHNQSAGFDYSTAGIEPWTLIGEGDRGVLEFSDWGIIAQGSISYDYISSQHHMDNRTANNKWFYVGEFNFSDATSQIHVRVVGSAQYNSQSETQVDYSNRTPEGATNIYLQARDGANTIGSWYGEGSSPVVKVHISGNGARTKLYVKIAAYTGFSTALVTTNGKDRYQAGLCFIFRKSFTACSAEESATLDAAPVVAFEQHWIGNKDVGFGYNNNKELLLRGTVIKGEVEEYEPGKYRTRRYLKVRVNGEEWSIPLNDANNPYI